MWEERAEEQAQALLRHANLTADEIRAMPMEEYAKIRGKLLDYGRDRLREDWKKVQEENAVSHTCMWCGEVIEGDLEAHEEECGA